MSSGHRITIAALAAIGALVFTLSPAGASVDKFDASADIAPVSVLAGLLHPGALPAGVKPSTQQAVAITGKSPGLGTSATPATTLPLVSFNMYDGAIAVDDAHQHVFISGGEGIHGLVVTDFSGNVITTLETGTSVTGLYVDEATGALYASLYDYDAIAMIDTGTLAETERWATRENPHSLMLANGQFYFTGGLGGAGMIESLDPSTGTVTLLGVTATHIAAIPGHPDWLAYAEEDAGPTVQVGILDVSTAPAHFYAANTSSVSDFAVTTDGKYLLFGGPNIALNVSTSLDQAFTFAPANQSMAVATEGDTYALGDPAGTGVNLAVYRFGSATPTSQFQLAAAASPHGLALSGDGTHLFAVSDDVSSGVVSLMVANGVDRIQTTMSLTMAHRLGVGKGATLSGSISFTNQAYDGNVRSVQVSRTDPTGTHVLPDVSTDTTGKFTFTDAGTPLGKVTYTVTFAGDATHGPVAQTKAGLREVPFDFNGDGYADLAVGSPGEDIGTVANAGDLTILPGTATGVTGTGSREIDLNTAGVPGTAATSDQFGWSQVSGDFNGDGYPDLAVSANGKNTPLWQYAGAVWIFYGSPSGLRTDNVTMVDPTSFPTVNGYTNAFLGEVMAAGDFNGDGIDDLASTVFAGQPDIVVMYGTTTGLGTTPHMIIGDSWGFGASLSTGDVNGDGYADLAVGSPLDKADKTYDAGAVSILYGSSSGLTLTGKQKFNKDTTGVPGSVKPYTTDMPDEFGLQVVLADFNGDGRADLAVSAPGSPVVYGGVSHEDAGTVTVLYSVGGKISTTGSVEVTQGTTGMPGNPGKNDKMGMTMAAGDSNGDGKADLVEFSPGDHYVTVIKGGSSGLSFSTAVAWTQNSTGIPGTDEAGDGWGDSLRFGNFKASTGPQALAVGADGENSSQGSVTVIYSTTSGLTGTGSVAFSQNSTGVPGTSENGDMFGSFFSS